MAISRFDPFEETRSLRRMMDRFFDGWPGMRQELPALPVDVSEKDGKVYVRASLPGFRREDIDVSIENGMLTVRANRSDDREERGERFYRRERFFGAVSRSVELPGHVDENQVSAEFKDGELTIEAPLTEQEKTHRIEIRG